MTPKATSVTSSAQPLPPSAPVRVSVEAPAILVKLEAQTTGIPSIHAPVHGPVKMRTLNEGGHEVFELCSDSDSDAGHDSDVEVTDALTHGASRSSSPFHPGPLDANGM